MSASLLDQLVQDRDAIKSQLDSLRSEIRRIIAAAYGTDFVEDLETDEDLLSALWNLCAIIEARDKTIASYRDMFPCSVCGKPMSWKPDDPLGQALRKFVRENRWGHSSCVKQRKP